MRVDKEKWHQVGVEWCRLSFLPVGIRAVIDGFLELPRA